MRASHDIISWPEQYVEFFELFNQREYFESHEVLEDLWIMETGPEKNYYKGMIMVTIALEHWRRGNSGGAWRLWRDGDALLSAYPETWMGFELGQFRTRLCKMLKKIIETQGKDFDPCDVSGHPVLRLISAGE